LKFGATVHCRPLFLLSPLTNRISQQILAWSGNVSAWGIFLWCIFSFSGRGCSQKFSFIARWCLWTLATHRNYSWGESRFQMLFIITELEIKKLYINLESDNVGPLNLFLFFKVFWLFYILCTTIGISESFSQYL
jgi:hypothetical protein